MSDEELAAEIARTVGSAVVALSAGRARTEALAEYVPSRRRLGVRRAARMLPLGRVWRLGVLLLDADVAADGGPLRAMGGAVRAVEPGHPGHVAASVEDRREHRAAAFRGPFARGETVDYDAIPVPSEIDALRHWDGPVFVTGEAAFVRWSPAVPDEHAAPLAAYLAERVDLLLHPPHGA